MITKKRPWVKTSAMDQHTKIATWMQFKSQGYKKITFTNEEVKSLSPRYSSIKKVMP